MFINYMEPHLPYNPPPPYNMLYMPKYIISDDIKDLSPEVQDIRNLILKKQRSQKELAVIKALYDGEINYLDKRIGELYNQIRELKIIDNTLLIITSDHGENLGDHGMVGHAFGLFNTLLEVPLIIRYPKNFKPGLVINKYVQTTDIFYTVLDAAGLELNFSNFNISKSLIRRIKYNDYQDLLISEHDKPTHILRWAAIQKINADHINKDFKTIIFNGYKYVQSSKGEEELYNLDNDPNEINDILSLHPEIALFLRNKQSELDRKVDAIEFSEKIPEMDEATRKKLRSLGYIK